MPGSLGVLLFVVVILLVILFHEAGHFFAAKAFGIKVQEFFVGFGPRLWSIRRGDTEYGVKAIPAGGYVKIAGMSPYEEVPPEDRGRTYDAKPPWQRAIVLLAGSATHFVLALLLLIVFFSAVGIPTRFSPQVVQVEARLEGAPSPAAAAGLQPGDEFVELDGRPVEEYEAFIEYTRSRPGTPIQVVVERDGERVPLAITPVLSELEGERVGRLGVVLSPGSILERDRVNPIAAVGRAGQMVGDMVIRSFQAMGEVFSPSGLARIGRQLVGQEVRDLDRDPAGVVGAARLSGQAVSAGAFDVLFFLFAGFNVFIGLLNLMPLPPLDGGHLAVVVVEKVSGRRVDVRKLMPLTILVIGFLILFFISITILDITSPLDNPFR